MNDRTILIIGGGISGLAAAYALQQRNIPYMLMDAGPEPGGVIQSLQKDGFQLDAGPNSLGATPHTLAFIRQIGLEPALMEATAAGRHRFLVRNGRLHAVSPHPLKILASGYLSGPAKWRLFTERFRAPQPAGEESVAGFVARRFGQEICDYLFDPILSGIYAGDTRRLSVQEVLPFLPRWEKEHGSVTKGLMKNREAMAGRKIIAFRGGNQALVKRLQELLTGSLRFNCAVNAVTYNGEEYTVKYNDNGQPATLHINRILFTTPAYATAGCLQGLDDIVTAALRQVYYPRMGVLHLGFDRSTVKHIPEGFGFLVPHAEKLHFLGAICNTAVFPHSTPAGKVLFTVFTGGAQQEHFFDELGEHVLQQKVISELGKLLQLTAPPVMQHFTRWEKAIPQLNTGHRQVRTAVQAFEQRFPGIYISGNYLSGVAVPDILQQAEALTERISG